MKIFLKHIKDRKTKMISTVVFVTFLVSGVFFFLSKQKVIVMDNKIFHPSSTDFETNAVKRVVLLPKDKYFYKSGKTGIGAAIDFLKKTKGLITPEFLKNADIRTENNAVFFQQKIGEMPVFDGELVVHLKNGGEVTGVSGGTLKNLEGPGELKNVDLDELKQVALSKAKTEAGNVKLKVNPKFDKFILNPEFIGFTDDSTNHLVYAFLVTAVSGETLFETKYFVDVNLKKVVFQQSFVQDLLNRIVVDCAQVGKTVICSNSRIEGQFPSGVADLDGVYDRLGRNYKFYKSMFGRDGHDDKGTPLKANTRINFFGGCPNAWWSGGQNAWSFCENVVNEDIVAHEYAHAITGYTAGLVYSYQSGALNESISDMFGAEADGNWTLGEGSAVGVIRDMSDPPKYSHPDKLWSSLYTCTSNDKGGVHTNSGVPNKAFYLMSQGGFFNGCEVKGIGSVRVVNIIYRALTGGWLSKNSSFALAASGLVGACNELYNEKLCKTVEEALQATEMDQGGPFQKGPLCLGNKKFPPGSKFKKDWKEKGPICRAEKTPIPTKASVKDKKGAQVYSSPTLKPIKDTAPTSGVIVPTNTPTPVSSSTESSPPTSTPMPTRGASSTTNNTPTPTPNTLPPTNTPIPERPTLTPSTSIRR